MPSKVYLWNVNDIFDEFHEDGNRYVTDVFHRDRAPSVGSFLVGLRNSSNESPDDGVTFDAIGLAHSRQAIATRKVRIRVEPVLVFSGISLSALQTGWRSSLKYPLHCPPTVEAHEVPTAAAATLLELLRSLEPKIGSWLDQLAAFSESVVGNEGFRLCVRRARCDSTSD
ncbi:MAG: hypothetical protein ACYDEY_04310 [Acidimicrobiales bacterium]